MGTNKMAIFVFSYIKKSFKMSIIGFLYEIKYCSQIQPKRQIGLPVKKTYHFPYMWLTSFQNAAAMN